MSQFRDDLKRTFRSSFWMGTVRTATAKTASVKLDDGRILPNLPFAGGPVSAGQRVRVVYIGDHYYVQAEGQQYTAPATSLARSSSPGGGEAIPVDQQEPSIWTEAEHAALGNSSPHHAPVTLAAGSPGSLTGQELDLSGIGSDTLPTDGFLVASFFDETDETLRIFYSLNGGFDWTDIGATFGDTARDPSIVWNGGKWWIAHTHNGAPTDVIPIRSSENLLDWSSVVELDTSAMGNPGAFAWAPEWFVDSDGSVHLLVACGDANKQIYETHPTDAAWTTWSNLVVVAGTLPADMIDPFIIKLGGKYYLWFKDDATGYLCLATSTSLTSDYTQTQSGNWAGFGSSKEGECLVPVSAVTWRIYYNPTLTNGVLYAESSDNFNTWTTPAAITGLSDVSHGTILNITDLSSYYTILNLLGVAPAAHASTHQDGGSDAIKLDDLATPDDNTDLNASTTSHGLLPKLSGSASDILKGDGTWGTGSGGAITIQDADGTPAVANVDTIVVPNGTLTDDGSGQVTLNFGSAATDGAAIHDNVAGEIAALTEKASPVAGDWVILEDSEDGNTKKKAQAGNLPGGSGGGAPTTAKYVTAAADSTLSGEIVIPSFAGHPDIPPASPSAYNDEFDSATLDVKWSKDGTEASYDINTTWPSRLYANFSGNQYLSITQDFLPGSGAFSVTAKFHTFLLSNYSQVFIDLVSADLQSGVRWNHITSNGLKGELSVLNGGTWSYAVKAITWNSTCLPGHAVYLHLQRDASDNWLGWTSFDGFAFAAVTAYNKPFTVGKMILRLDQNGVTRPTQMGIDWVRFNWRMM